MNVAPGTPVVPPKSTLRISSGEVDSAASRYFGVIEFTFENDSSEWIEITQLGLDFGSPARNQAVLVPWGSDIDVWEAATSTRNAIRYANTQTALSLLAIGGGIGRATRGRHASGRLGGVVQAGALTALVAQDLTAGAEAAETVDRFPANHLFTLPIRIPPGLFTKRWILLNTHGSSADCVDSVVLTYEVAGHPPEHALFKFKGYASAWQMESCSPTSSSAASGHL